MVRRRRDIEGVQRALEHHIRNGVLRRVQFDPEQPKPFLIDGESGMLPAERMSVDDAYWLVIGIRLAEITYATNARIADLVFALLDGKEWDGDTLQEIGLVFANLGRPPASSDDDHGPGCDGPLNCTCSDYSASCDAEAAAVEIPADPTGVDCAERYEGIES